MLSRQCNSALACHPDLAGWDFMSDGRYRMQVGKHITYILFFTKSEQGFSLYLYKSLDMGDEFIKQF